MPVEPQTRTLSLTCIASSCMLIVEPVSKSFGLWFMFCRRIDHFSGAAFVGNGRTITVRLSLTATTSSAACRNHASLSRRSACSCAVSSRTTPLTRFSPFRPVWISYRARTGAVQFQLV